MAKLFTPMKIGNMEVKNRTFMAPMSLGYESQDGCINENQAAFWLARARGGVGCIIVDATSVDPRTPYLGNTLSFRGADSIAKYKMFIDHIHSLGVKIIPQLTHPGPESVCSFFGVTPIASSEYLNAYSQKTRELKLEEIPSIIEMYANAAIQAKMAGYDGIELHAAHGYMLIGSFLSPLRNKRTDCYGGSLDNRARLLFEVIDAIKNKCGRDFPIVLRISGSEKNPNGNTLDDTLYLVPKLIEHGVDAFEISGGTQYERPDFIIPGHEAPIGANLEEARAIKKISSVPLITVGKFIDPQVAIDVVENDDVDGVVFGRALLADPDFVKKSQEGRFTEIAPCVACAVGCVGEQMKRMPASCVINPFAGKELTMVMTPAEKSKKIAIIGGGIAGMSCARVLAIRGHKPVIYEKNSSLGGQINVASLPPFKGELGKWTKYLANELERLNVDIILNHEVKKEEVDSLKNEYDEIVLATGATPIKLSIEGAQDALTAYDVISGKEKIMSNNVLIVGGGMVGIECAEYLKKNNQSSNITLLEMTKSIGNGLPPSNLIPTLKRVYQSGIRVITNAKLVKINNNNVIIEQEDGLHTLNDIDKVIFAVGSKSNQTLLDEKMKVIGDASSSRNALYAIREGVTIALEI